MKGSKAMLALATMALMADQGMHGRDQQSNFKVEREQSQESQVWRRKKCKSCSTFGYCSRTHNPNSKACNQYKSKK